MAWYKTGTATFTNGSPTVTGSGTAWVANSSAGYGIVGPDGRVYEVLSVNSDTGLTLSTNYQGTTAAGAAYLLVPTQDLNRVLAAQVTALIADYSTVKNNAGAGKFGDGTISQPGISFAADTDTGIRRYGANAAALVAGGVDSMVWSQSKLFLGPVAPVGGPSYPVVSFGPGQETANLTDAGNKFGGLYLQGSAVGAGSGGFVAFGTNFGNQTPFAAIKGFVINGANNTLGYLSTSMRLSDSATNLEEVTRVDNTRTLQVIGPNANLRLKGGITGDSGNDAAIESSANNLSLKPFGGITRIIHASYPSLSIQTTAGALLTLGRDVSNAAITSGTGHLLHYVPASSQHIFHVNGVNSLAIAQGTIVLPQPGSTIDIGPTASGANTPCALDFHSGTTALDYDCRLLSTGGNATLGQGSLTYTAGAGHYFGGNIQPLLDNAFGCGTSGLRWAVVYSATGAINTSDARKKTPVAPLTLAELEAATEMARELGTFRFLESVAEKGDAARKHAGMTVQRAIEIMESHGLDPFNYGFICYDEWSERIEIVQPRKVVQHTPHVIKHPAVTRHHEAVVNFATQAITSPAWDEVIEPAREEVIGTAWEEVLQEEETRIHPAGNVYSFRTDELLMFIARGQAARQDDLEARIAALEAA